MSSEANPFRFSFEAAGVSSPAALVVELRLDKYGRVLSHQITRPPGVDPKIAALAAYHAGLNSQPAVQVKKFPKPPALGAGN